MEKRRTVLITGSSRGIGRACAERLARENMNVIINYNKSEDKALEVYDKIRRYNPNVMVIKADVSKYDEVCRMFDEIEVRYKMVDCLVNNAGIATRKLFQDIEPEHWREIFDTNVNGTYNCCKRAVEKMISSKSGKIINMSSVWGMVGCATESHYAATKGAIIALTKSLAKELGYSGITVNSIAPGGVDTDMLSELDDAIIAAVTEEIPSGRLGTPEEIAEIVSFMLSKNADYFNGQIISPNGGLTI